MTDYNGTVTYSYDELGRMTSKARGSHSADYAYAYDDRMVEVDSDFPGEGLVTYNYGGNGARRTRTHDGTTTTYNWSGWAIASEEVSGSLTRSYVGRTMAHIDGSNPNTGDYAYYTHDHLMSTRGIFDGSKKALDPRSWTLASFAWADFRTSVTGESPFGGFDSHPPPPWVSSPRISLPAD